MQFESSPPFHSRHIQTCHTKRSLPSAAERPGSTSTAFRYSSSHNSLPFNNIHTLALSRKSALLSFQQLADSCALLWRAYPLLFQANPNSLPEKWGFFGSFNVSLLTSTGESPRANSKWGVHPKLTGDDLHTLAVDLYGEDFGAGIADGGFHFRAGVRLDQQHHAASPAGPANFSGQRAFST